MRQIYECASKVTIWLPAGQDSYLAIGLILELSHYLAADDPTDAELYRRYEPQRRSPRWLALGHVFDQPYFGRMWMVQEVAVNKTLHVVYGRETIKWDTLAPVILRLLMSFRFSTMIEDSITPAHKMKRMLSLNALFLDSTRRMYQGRRDGSSGHAASLLQMLPSCWAFNATDGRDKVFALISLARDPVNPLIEPDYTKPVEEVFLHTAWHLFSQEGSLGEILYCAGIGWPRRVPSLPSWVPDWSEVGRSVISTFPSLRMGYRTAVGLSNRGPIIHGAAMELDAIIIDSVDRMTQEFRRPDVDTDAAVLEETASWLREVRGLAASITGSEEALWRTLICDAPSVGIEDFSTGMEWPAAEVYGRWYGYCMQHLLQEPGFDAEPGLTPDQVAERMQLGGRWCASAQFRCYARRFAVTRAGRMALLPALVEVGDAVAIIPGTNVPFILRSKGRDVVSGRDVYALVGECYLHGIMNGEMAGASPAEIIILE